jgi:hypothetical protein
MVHNHQNGRRYVLHFQLRQNLIDFKNNLELHKCDRYSLFWILL